MIDFLLSASKEIQSVQPIHIQKILEARSSDKLVKVFLSELANPEIKIKHQEV